MLRYGLFQLPGWILLTLVFVVLHVRFGTPVWVGAVVLGAWILKDAALYPLVRDSYHPWKEDASRRVVGSRGSTEEPLDPEGWVRVGAELWRAQTETGEHLARGREVRVRDVRGLTLFVEPADDD